MPRALGIHNIKILENCKTSLVRRLVFDMQIDCAIFIAKRRNTPFFKNSEATNNEGGDDIISQIKYTFQSVTFSRA